MKLQLLNLALIFVCPFLFGQILTVNSGSSISVSSGSSITIDGLDIAPDYTFVISGANDVSRSVTAATSKSNSSVSRVYSSTALLSDFTGTLTFSYLDGDLNGIVEGDLVLELQADDDSWVTYIGSVDEINNTVSYTFNDPVSFKAITASSANATLTIDEAYPLDSGISVYPNPTANRIYIQGENILQAELFDLIGRKVKDTSQNQIDLSDLGSGSFILKVTIEKNKSKLFKIIKQ